GVPLSTLPYSGLWRPPCSTPFPSTSLFRSAGVDARHPALRDAGADHAQRGAEAGRGQRAGVAVGEHAAALPDQRSTEHTHGAVRSEEHTSELQSRENLVCRLLLEKKKTGPT